MHKGFADLSLTSWVRRRMVGTVPRTENAVKLPGIGDDPGELREAPAARRVSSRSDDPGFKVVFDAIRQLMAPPEAKRRRIDLGLRANAQDGWFLARTIRGRGPR